MKKVLMFLFLTLVISICFLGVVQFNDTTETKIEKSPATSVTEVIQ